jgi:hypothetical protein
MKYLPNKDYQHTFMQIIYTNMEIVVDSVNRVTGYGTQGQNKNVLFQFNVIAKFRIILPIARNIILATVSVFAKIAKLSPVLVINLSILLLSKFLHIFFAENTYLREKIGQKPHVTKNIFMEWFLCFTCC